MRFSNPPEALDCCGDPQLFCVDSSKLRAALLPQRSLINAERESWE